MKSFRQIRWSTRKSVIFSAAVAVIMVTASLSDGAVSPAPGSKDIVFIAGGPSHGFLAHDYLAGSKLLASRIETVPGFKAAVYYEKWPPPEAFEHAAAIIVYADGGPENTAIPHQAELLALSRKGVGIGMIHYAVEVPKETAGQQWLDMIGGYFETFHSVNPFWLAQFTTLAAHPVTNGVKPFRLDDEWYYNMRFRKDMRGVHPLLSAIPPDESRLARDDPHAGNPDVRSGTGQNKLEHVLWVSENFDAAGKEPVSRGFGCTGGHSHQNWANDQFRKIVLNAIVWVAKGTVPNDGVQSRRPDVDELLSNRDPGVPEEQVPPNFDKQKLAREIEQINGLD